jgi:hypothetical protein
MLLISFGVLVYCKVFSSPVSKQQDFINRVLKNGGIVHLFSNGGEAVSNQQFTGDFNDIEAITFFNENITETDIVNIPPLKKLKELSFNNTKLNADIFSRLETTDLRCLMFRCGFFSDNLILSRGQLNHLNDLGIYQMKMPDTVFKKWGGLAINRLIIMETPDISEVGLKYLLPQNDLEMVILWYTSITDKITEFFDGCPKLKNIEIVGGDLRCEFIRDMKWADKIEEIDISETNLDDEILNSITRFNRLKSLLIMHCNVTEKSRPLLENLSKKIYSVGVRSEGINFHHTESNNYYKNYTPEELEKVFEKE